MFKKASVWKSKGSGEVQQIQEKQKKKKYKKQNANPVLQQNRVRKI